MRAITVYVSGGPDALYYHRRLACLSGGSHRYPLGVAKDLAFAAGLRPCRRCHKRTEVEAEKSPLDHAYEAWKRQHWQTTRDEL
jgi:hypothetical protein